METTQYEDLMATLEQIRDRLPVPVRPHTNHSVVQRTSVTAEADKLAGAIEALEAMIRVAEAWAEQAHENQVLSTAPRDVKSVRYQEFVLADILNMVDDAAREIGISGFRMADEEGRK